MTFVKTFESFRSSALTEAVDKANISKISPKEGELERWSIVLKSGSEGSISDKNPAQTILDKLVANGDFKTWWTSARLGANGATPADKTLGIVYSGPSGKKNLIGRDVAKAEIAFRLYSVQSLSDITANQKAAAAISYDVTKVKPLAVATVPGSDVKLAVWHEEDLPKITLGGSITATDKAGKVLPIDSVYPEYMASQGQSATDKSTVTTDTTTAATSATTTNTTAATNTSTSTAATTSYVTLKKAASFSQQVQDLQKKIKAIGGEAAIALGKLGADGKYGGGTANAISKIVGSSTPVVEITAEVSDKLNAAFANLTQAQIDAANPKKSDTPVKPKNPVKPKENPGF